MTAKKPALGLTLVLAMLALVAPSLAQDAPSSFGEVIDVRIVNLEVVVEDGGGERVEGLEPDAFRILIDGREVPIAHFSEIRRGRSVHGERGSASAQPRLVPGTQVGNSFVLFIDDYFAVGAQRNLILERLARQLDALDDPSQIAIVSFGGRRLELLSDWTSDRRAVRSALDTASRRNAFGLLRFSERERRGFAVPPGALSGYFEGESEHELGRVAAAMVSAMQAFADAPGRKILLALSGGWPAIDPSYLTRVRGNSRWIDDRDILSPVTDTANLLGFTIYPIDIPGFRETLTDVDRRVHTSNGLVEDLAWRQSAGNRTQSYNGVSFSSPTEPAFFSGQTSRAVINEGRLDLQLPGGAGLQEAIRISTLRSVARKTGGRPLLGSDRLNALPAVTADLDDYYWLSFAPEREFDGEEHRIRVQVDGQNYRVRSRRSFRDHTVRAQATVATLGAALRGAAVGDAEQDLVVELGAAEKVGFRKFLLPLRVEIPLERLAFLPADGGYVANVELRMAAVDDSGAHSEVPIVPVRLFSASPPQPGEVQLFETSVTLKRGSQTLALSLFDAVAGQVLVATLEVDL